MNICYIGNSVSAQKVSYKDLLNRLLISSNAVDTKSIHCTLGGIGSLGINFFIDRFVGNTPIHLCFIETFVADLGGATPHQYIAPALRGIMQNTALTCARIVPIYLYRSDVTWDAYVNILKIYNDVFAFYGITPINVFAQVNEMIAEGVICSTDVVYDQVHTTALGAELYANFIHQQLQNAIQSLERKSIDSTNSLAIVPKTLEQLSNYISDGTYTHGRFRFSLPYIQIDSGTAIEFTLSDFGCIGLIVIADLDTGVVQVRGENWVHTAQIFDVWCHRSRLQVVLFPKPVFPHGKLSVEASTTATADSTANLCGHAMTRIGNNIKIVHLMGFEPASKGVL